MSDEYNINIKSAGLDYQFKLIPTQSQKPGIVIGGITYSVHPRNRQERQAIELFLNSAQLGAPTTIKELAGNLKRMPQVEAVTVTKQKTHLTALSTLIPANPLKQQEVEANLIPRIPSTQGPVQPTHILQRMSELGVPGVGIAVIHRGKVEWSAGYGDLAASPLVQAGSVSKMVNGLVVLSLIDQCEQAQEKGVPSGLVNDQVITLDTDVSTLIDAELWHSIDPDHITAGDRPKLTIRDLLAHTGGIPGHGGFNGYPRVANINEEIDEITGQIAEMARPPTLELSGTLEVLQRRLDKCLAAREAAYAGDIPDTEGILRGQGNSPHIRIEWAPGTRWQYSGGGSTVLQKIVETVTGKDYPEVVKERVLDRLEATRSTFHPADDAVAAGTDIDGDPLPGGWNQFPEYAAAGMWSTPTDLAKIIIGIQEMLRGAPNGIISPDLIREMTTPEKRNIPAALGMFVEQTPHSTYFFHSGSTQGYRCMAIGNSDGMGAVVMTNSVSGEHLYDEIFPAIIKAYGWSDGEDLPMFRPALEPQELKAIEQTTAIDEAKWAACTGRYEFNEQGALHTVEVSAEEGKFIVRVDSDPPFELKPLTDSMGLYRQSKSGPQEVLRFTRSPDGAIQGLVLFGAMHQKTS